MSSSIVMFVLAFVVLGLLLGIAEVHDAPQANVNEQNLPQQPAAGNMTGVSAASDDALPKDA